MIYIKPILSIIIPALNEEKRLPLTLSKILRWFEEHEINIEIILIIEPSTDNTLEIAKKWSEKYKNITYYINQKRLGKGRTVQKGMLQANGKYVAFLDADGPVNLDVFNISLQKMEKKYPIAIASRALPESKIISPEPLLRKIFSLLFRISVRLIVKVPQKDTQCGCKIFHHDAIEPLFNELVESGFAFDVELLYKAQLYDYNVLEVPCVLNNQSDSSVRPIKDGFDMLFSLFRIKKHYKKK